MTGRRTCLKSILQDACRLSFILSDNFIYLPDDGLTFRNFSPGIP